MTDDNVLARLHTVRSLSWARLHPAIDHAIALAREAEYLAGHTSIACQMSVQPEYPPLVLLLADAAALPGEEL